MDDEQQQLLPQETQAITSSSPSAEPDVAEETLFTRTDNTLAVVANSEISSPVNVTQLDCGLPLDQVETLLQPCLSEAESRVSKALQEKMESVESQILCALQQAALDIVEHLGKEAATRVIVAERKAAVLEWELINAKQQALSMLLSLKCSTDAQISEAEKKYQIERRRAQDAEAKLAAAQDMMKRLKGELRRKGGILEKMQKLVEPAVEEQLDVFSGIGPDERRTGYRGIVSDVHSKVPQPEADNLVAFNMGNGNNVSDMNNCSPQVLPYGIYPVNMHSALPSTTQAQNENSECSAETHKFEPIDEEQLIASSACVDTSKPNFDSDHTHSVLERKANGSSAEALSIDKTNELNDTGLMWKVGSLSDKDEVQKEYLGFQRHQLETVDTCFGEQDQHQEVQKLYLGFQGRQLETVDTCFGDQDKHEEGRPIEKYENLDSDPLEEAKQTDAAGLISFPCLEDESREEGQSCNAATFGNTDSRTRTSNPLEQSISNTVGGLPRVDQSLVSNEFIACRDQEEIIAGCTLVAQDNKILMSAQEVSEVGSGQSENNGRCYQSDPAIAADEQINFSMTSDVPANAGSGAGCMLKTEFVDSCDIQNLNPCLDLSELSAGSQLQLEIRPADDICGFELPNEPIQSKPDDKTTVFEEALRHFDNVSLSQPISNLLQTQQKAPAVSELGKEGKQELQADTESIGVSTRDTDLAACVPEIMKPFTDPQFLEPDHEVAVSLANISESIHDSREALQTDTAEIKMITRASKLGLRKMHRGIRIEQQGGSEVEDKIAKKPRKFKGHRGSERCLGKITGKSRGSASSQKDSLVVESSRDNRRLMQGARQLFSLSEKKWW